MISLAWEMITSPGGRAENEDRCNFLALPGAVCFVAADGLGGHGGGEVAAQIAVDTVLERFAAEPSIAPESLAAALAVANAAILARQREGTALAQMRSTAVLLASDYDSAAWAHVGDSRLYHFRDGAVLRQTRDHSVPQALADAGGISADQIRFHEDRSRLRRSLGSATQSAPSVCDSPAGIEPGDAFLLCTDGFWEYVAEDVMLDELVDAAGPADWLARMEAHLCGVADGDHDNYTAIAVMAAAP